MLSFPNSLSSVLRLLALASIALLLGACSSREERIQKVRSKANEALFANQSEKALKILEEGLSKYSESNEIRIALARALGEAAQYPRAASLMTEAIEADPSQNKLWLKVANYRVLEGESDKAILAFEEYLKNNGDDFLAWKQLAQENEKKGRLTAAIKAVGRWNDLTPSADPALKLGELYQTSSNLPQARSWYSQAAAYPASSAAKEGLIRLIQLETSLKQFQQAETWLSAYVEKYGPTASDPRIAEAVQAVKDWRRANEEIARAARELEKERQALEAQRAQATKAAEEQARQLAASMEQAEEQARFRDPQAQTASTGDVAPMTLFSDGEAQGEGTPFASELRGESGGPTAPTPPAAKAPATPADAALAAMELENHDAAIDLLLQALGNDAQNPELWYLLSKAYSAKEMWFDAEAMILEARRRAPRSESVAAQYAKTVAHTQASARALEEIKSLRMLFPRNADLALTLAQTLRAAGATQRIVAGAYQDFLKLATPETPGYPEATRYLRSGQ